MAALPQYEVTQAQVLSLIDSLEQQGFCVIHKDDSRLDAEAVKYDGWEAVNKQNLKLIFWAKFPVTSNDPSGVLTMGCANGRAGKPALQSAFATLDLSGARRLA